MSIDSQDSRPYPRGPIGRGESSMGFPCRVTLSCARQSQGNGGHELGPEARAQSSSAIGFCTVRGALTSLDSFICRFGGWRFCKLTPKTSCPPGGVLREAPRERNSLRSLVVIPLTRYVSLEPNDKTLNEKGFGNKNGSFETRNSPILNRKPPYLKSETVSFKQEVVLLHVKPCSFCKVPFLCRL